MLEQAERLVNERGTPLSLATLPLDDTPTYELLSRAETQGVFQLESAGMRDALRKLKPDCFEDIIAMVVALSAGPDGQHPALHQRQAQGSRTRATCTRCWNRSSPRPTASSSTRSR